MSVEFHSKAEGRRGNLREIRQALLGGAALVDAGSYAGATVEVRAEAEARAWTAEDVLLMAVTLTQLAAALRLGDGENPPTEPVLGLITRLLGVSQAFVARAAPEAPDAIADEATIRMTAYLYDSPTAAAGGRYAQAWRNSGAEAPCIALGGP